MMTRLISFIAVLLIISGACATPAQASPETAEDWGAKASALYRTTAELLSAINTDQSSDFERAYLDELAQFSVIAGRLAVWVDTSGGAKDFGCIYRGMAEEAELQLEALETANTQADARTALTRIATLLDDAQSIAVASAHAARSEETEISTGHCPASRVPLTTYLEAGRGS